MDLTVRVFRSLGAAALIGDAWSVEFDYVLIERP